MPDRSRNRPRIAGQRRTAGLPGTTRTVEDLPVTEEVTTKATEVAPEAVPGDVSPATPEVSEAGEVATDEVAEAPAVTDGDERRGGPGGVLTVVLAVAVVLVLTVSAVLGIKAWHGKQAEDARDQAAAAGRKAAETALSYDYRHLDADFAASRATMTPDFAAKFDETAKVAGELATKTKATVKADVREVGVRDGDADRVTLIIFVNQTTTSTITQGKPRVDLNRTRFTMVRNGDRWLVQEIAGL
jgi:Mce-associated membrane protein